jgi:hypothetical protein
VQSGLGERCAPRGRCDLCRHDELVLGRKLCPACLEAIARLAYAVGVRASPFLTSSAVESCSIERRIA